MTTRLYTLCAPHFVPSYFAPPTFHAPTLCTPIICVSHYAPQFTPYTLRPQAKHPMIWASLYEPRSLLCAPSLLNILRYLLIHSVITSLQSLPYRPILLLSFMRVLFRKNECYGTHNYCLERLRNYLILIIYRFSCISTTSALTGPIT